MLKILRRFAALSVQEKFILIQAWSMLGLFRAAIVRIPLKHLASSLDHHIAPLELTPVDEHELEAASRIGKLVAIAARFTPWQSRCLVQVLVTQRLLSGCNIPGQFHLGVSKSGENGSSSTDFSAHAWLQCGDEIVNGEPGHETFTIVSSYSWGSLRR